MNGTFSHAVYRDLLREFQPRDYIGSANPILSPAQSLFGIPVRVSGAFPHQFQCSTCQGTGEGVDRTYCRRCSGAGQVRIEGVVQNGRQTTMLTAKLPKAFAPHFPTGLVSPAPLARGLR